MIRMYRFRMIPIVGAIAAMPAFPQGAGTARVYDFENATQNSTYGGFGYTYTDEHNATAVDTIFGNSRIWTQSFHENPDSMSYAPGRNDSSLYSFRTGFRIGDRPLSCGGTCTYPPQVGIGFPFSPNDTLDLTGATHITFWAKAHDSMKVAVHVATADSGNAEYTQNFSIDTTWKKYSIALVPSTEFALPSWAFKKPFNLSRVKGMGMTINKEMYSDSSDNALYVDDIEIVNWTYVDPASIRSGRFADRASRALRFRRDGSVLRMRLPDALVGKRGMVEAVDAAGRILGRRKLAGDVSEMSLQLEVPVAPESAVMLRLKLD